MDDLFHFYFNDFAKYFTPEIIFPSKKYILLFCEGMYFSDDNFNASQKRLTILMDMYQMKFTNLNFIKYFFTFTDIRRASNMSKLNSLHLGDSMSISSKWYN